MCNGKCTDFVIWKQTCPWCIRPFFPYTAMSMNSFDQIYKTYIFFVVAMIHPEMKHIQNPTTTYIRIVPWASSKLQVVIKLLVRRIFEYVPGSWKNVRNTHHLFCSSYLAPFNILTVFFWEKYTSMWQANPKMNKWTQLNPPKMPLQNSRHPSISLCAFTSDNHLGPQSRRTFGQNRTDPHPQICFKQMTNLA